MDDHDYEWAFCDDPEREAMESDFNIMMGGGLENEWARRQALEDSRLDLLMLQEYEEDVVAGRIAFGPPEPVDIPF